MCVQDFGMGGPERNILIGKHRRRWVGNVKMYLQEVGWGAGTGFIMARIGTDGGLF